jgi:hypothetical protein
MNLNYLLYIPLKAPELGRAQAKLRSIHIGFTNIRIYLDKIAHEPGVTVRIGGEEALGRPHATSVLLKDRLGSRAAVCHMLTRRPLDLSLALRHRRVSSTDHQGQTEKTPDVSSHC